MRDSYGYTASQLNLGSLAGQSVRFRFRLGTDNCCGDYGWFIDDVRIYTCALPPSLSIQDVAITEGTSGSQTALFMVTLSGPSNVTVSVNFDSAPGSATAGADYTHVAGVLSIPPGNTWGTISVPIVTDTTPEPDETFTVNLSAPVNAVIADGAGDRHDPERRLPGRRPSTTSR